MTPTFWSEVDSPIGPIGLASSDRGLLALFLANELPGRDARLRRLVGELDLVPDDGRHEPVRHQVAEYFAGRRRAFDLPLDRRGTPFQLAVWREVSAVPYGRTATYGQLARRIGKPRAVRAVGAANGDNPLPVVVPCHRIVGSHGHLTGYGGTTPRKQALLALEGAVPRTGEGWLDWAARRAADQPSLLIGPRSTHIFCRPSCCYGARIKNVPALFDSPAEAMAEGFRACRVCRPA